MSKPYTSPTLASAIEGFWDALHAAYPQIETEGVRPKRPGLFIGEVAGETVQVIPRPRAPQLYLMNRPSPHEAYLRFGFTKFKQGARYRFGQNDEEVVLLVWLLEATKELRAMTSP